MNKDRANRHLKKAKESLVMAENILSSVEDINQKELQRLKNAAIQAKEANEYLLRIVGMIEGEMEEQVARVATGPFDPNFALAS